MPTVSVIMPVWGAEKFIEFAIVSVLDQDLVDLELILVDDCSPDQSTAVARRVIEQRNESRVRIISRETNGGVSAARNTGLKHATGEFVCFIDNDDRYSQGFLSHLVGEARTDSGIDIVASRPTRVLVSGATSVPPPVSDWPVTVTGREAARLSLHDRISCFPWDKLYRRRLFERLAFPEGILYEDMVLTTLLCLSAKRVRLVQEARYLYYTRAASQTWVNVPSTSDLEKALAFLETGLGDAAYAPDIVVGLRRRRFQMVLHLAARALLRTQSDPSSADIVTYCRRELDLVDIPRVLAVDRFLAMAALGLKASPNLYGRFYRWYARRTYSVGN